jgi:hypothetical protein
VGIAQCTKALLHASQYVFREAAYPSERAKRIITSTVISGSSLVVAYMMATGGLTWSLTSGPVELVEVRVNWPGHPR